MAGIGDAAGPAVPIQVITDAVAAAQAAAALAARAAGPSATPVAGALRLRTGTQAAAVATQQSLCSAAAAARARNNPAAPGLAQSCQQQREANIAAGQLEVDALTLNDGATRVALATAGRAIMAREPALASAAQASGNERAFAIGVACARGGNPAYTAGVRAGMSAADAPGFDRGMLAASPTQQGPSGPSDDSGGIPRAALIGGGVVGVLAIAAVAYKLTRKRR